MEHPLAHYYPDDFPWRKLVNILTLKHQCEARNLSSEGTLQELQQRLVDHCLTNFREQRHRPWLVQPRPFYTDTLASARATTFRIVRIQNKSGPGWEYRNLRLEFTLTRDGDELFRVLFKQGPSCNCGFVPQKRQPRRCVHIMYILRLVLNVPQPLRWQVAFLPSEIQKICGNSHPVQALLQPDRYHGATHCLVCFRERGNGVQCGTCRIAMHMKCVNIVRKVRASDYHCPVCLDKAAWGLERFRGTSVDRPFDPAALYADYDDSESSYWDSSDYEEEDDSNNSIREISPDEPFPDEEPPEDEQPPNAPVQPNNQQPRSNTPGLYIKQSFSPPPRLGPRSPSILIKDESSPSPPPQQPPSSPLRRRQPSRAAKDRGLVRQSLAATAEAPADTPRRTQGRALRRTPASNRPAHVPVQSNTPIPLPVIPAQALQQIQQQQHNQERHTARTNNAPVPLIPAAAPLVAPVEALASGSGSAAQAPAQPAVAPTPQAPGFDAISAPVGSSAAVSSSPAPAPSSGTAPPRASARAGVDKRRKAAKLARKLESIARESAYVREHLRTLAKKSKRLEKKAKALAKENEAGGDE